LSPITRSSQMVQSLIPRNVGVSRLLTDNLCIPILDWKNAF